MPLSKFGPRELGVGIVLCSALVLVISFYSISDSLKKEAEQCALVCGDMGHEGCTHTEGLPPYVFLNFFFIIALCGSGVLVYLKGDDWAGRKAVRLPPLAEDEKRLYEEIKKADGAIFQAELVEKAGMTKVKVTRILDKLEGKGVIERKRRGMTNVVILK
ncbi:MAG: MarR family transcriptional regulator [archaeon]